MPTIRKRTKYRPEMIHVLRRCPDGSWESLDGRFAAWFVTDRHWYWFDVETGAQHATTSKAECVEQIVGVRRGGPAPPAVPNTPRPGKKLGDPKQATLKFKPAVVGRIKPSPVRIVRLTLAEDEGQQIVLGRDERGVVHVLWSTPQ